MTPARRKREKQGDSRRSSNTSKCSIALSSPASTSPSTGRKSARSLTANSYSRFNKASPTTTTTVYTTKDMSSPLAGKFHSDSAVTSSPDDERKLATAATIKVALSSSTTSDTSTENNKAAIQQLWKTLDVQLRVNIGSSVRCSICLSAMSNPVRTPCVHAFCRDCILASLICKKECPECKSSLHRRQLQPFHFLEDMKSAYKDLLKDFGFAPGHYVADFTTLTQKFSYEDDSGDEDEKAAEKANVDRLCVAKTWQDHALPYCKQITKLQQDENDKVVQANLKACEDVDVDKHIQDSPSSKVKITAPNDTLENPKSSRPGGVQTPEGASVRKTATQLPGTQEVHDQALEQMAADQELQGSEEDENSDDSNLHQLISTRRTSTAKSKFRNKHGSSRVSFEMTPLLEMKDSLVLPSRFSHPIRGSRSNKGKTYSSRLRLGRHGSASDILSKLDMASPRSPKLEQISMGSAASPFEMEETVSPIGCHESQSFNRTLEDDHRDEYDIDLQENEADVVIHEGKQGTNGFRESDDQEASTLLGRTRNADYLLEYKLDLSQKLLAPSEDTDRCRNKETSGDNDNTTQDKAVASTKTNGEVNVNKVEAQVDKEKQNDKTSFDSDSDIELEVDGERQDTPHAKAICANSRDVEEVTDHCDDNLEVLHSDRDETNQHIDQNKADLQPGTTETRNLTHACIPCSQDSTFDDEKPHAQPPPSNLQSSFPVGTVVNVESRTWPGVNKHGGVGRITAVNRDGTFNIAYVLGGKESNVDQTFVSKAEEMAIAEKGQAAQAARRRRRAIDELPPDLLRILAEEGFDTGMCRPVPPRKKKKRSHGALKDSTNALKTASAWQALQSTETNNTSSVSTTQRKRKNSSSSTESSHLDRYSAAEDTPSHRNASFSGLESKTMRDRNETSNLNCFKSEESTKKAIDQKDLAPTNEEAMKNASELYRSRFQKSLDDKLVVIATSGLSQDDSALLASFCSQTFKDDVKISLTETIDVNTTICIVSARQRGKRNFEASIRSLKTMRCCLEGVPMTTLYWIRVCSKEREISIPSIFVSTLPSKSKWIQESGEANYGVLRAASLLQTHSGNPFRPFSKYYAFVSGNHPIATKKMVTQLLQDGGATLLSSPSGVCSKLQAIMKEHSSFSKLVIVCGDSGPSLPKALEAELKRTLESHHNPKIVSVVTWQWVMESLTCAKAMPVSLFESKIMKDLR